MLRRSRSSSAGAERLAALALAALLAWGAAGCSPKDDELSRDDKNADSTRAINVIVVADLSDRIADTAQVARDLQVIRVVADAFQEHSRLANYPLSRDCLRFNGVRSTVLPLDLVVDVADMNERHVVVVDSIGPALDQFLAGCRHAYTPQKRYDGADLWGYFKDSLQPLLEPSCDNRIVLLTDGYLNFSPSVHAHRPPHTEMTVGKLRGHADWHALFPKVALAPVGRKFANTRMLVLEVAPKDALQSVDELDILKAYWSTWADSMGLGLGPGGENVLTHTTPLSTVKQRLTDFLEAR